MGEVEEEEEVVLVGEDAEDREEDVRHILQRPIGLGETLEKRSRHLTPPKSIPEDLQRKETLGKRISNVMIYGTEDTTTKMEDMSLCETPRESAYATSADVAGILESIAPKKIKEGCVEKPTSSLAKGEKSRETKKNHPKGFKVEEDKDSMRTKKGTPDSSRKSQEMKRMEEIWGRKEHF